MAYGVSGYGVSPYLLQTTTPPKRVYKSIEFFGDITLDDIHILDYEFTQTNVESLDVTETPIWDAHTLMLTNFNNENLNGGNLSGIVGNIDNILVYRKATDEAVFKLLATLDGTAKEYVDITALPKKTYQYEMVATNATERSEPVTGDNTLIDVYNNILIDTKTQEVAVFNLNLNEDKTTINTNDNTYQGISQYPSFLRGLANYSAVGMNAIPISNEGSLTNGIEQSADYLNNLKDMITNDNLKILKTRKGFVYKGQTFSMEHSSLNINITEQPKVVNFKFIETESL